MNTMRKMVTGFVMAAGLAASSASVLAQTPPPAPNAPAAQGQRPATPEQRQARMKEHFDRYANQLHAKLKLDQGQEAAWKTYLQAMAPEPRPQRPDRAQMESMTTPQRMEQRLNMMKDMEARMSKHLDATKVFYGQLNPDQQKIFDSENARMTKAMHDMFGPDHSHGAGKGRPQGAQQR